MKHVPTRWILVAVIGAATLGLATQFVNTRTVRNELCARVSNQGGCDATMGLGSVELGWTSSDRASAVRVAPSRLQASTWLVRRDCDNAWTLDFGARLEVEQATAENATTTLELEGGCVSTDGTASKGSIRRARLTSQGCVIQLAPFRFGTNDDVQVSIAATVEPSAAARCSALLPDAMREFAAKTLTSAKLLLSVRYEPAVASTGSTRTRVADVIADAVHSGGAGRILSAIKSSHDLEVTIGGGKASLHFETEPANESAVMRLAVRADEAVAAQLPDDVRPRSGGALTQSFEWRMNHEDGIVRVNGEDKRRRPLQAARAAGRVALLSSECDAAVKNRSLYFVEAGDHGEALRPEQVDGVMSALDAAMPDPGALVTVFVHGWHHSAAAGDSYVCGFSDVLGTVEDMEARAAGLASRPARTVIGVYVGWPGALYDDELANSVTTFWNRLETADRLGVQDALLRRLLAGLAQRLAPGRTGPRADRRSSLIVVGHSMGARAVFNALRDDLLDAGPAPQRLNPDVVLLVNPAFSAELYRSVHERNRECVPGRAPLLLFSSEADGVTRQIYPAGQAVTYPYSATEPTPFLEHVYTAANFTEFLTHRLTLEPVSGDPPAPEGPQTILRGFERVPAGSRELYTENPVTVYHQPATGRPRPGDVWYRLRLMDVATTRPCDAGSGKSAVIAVDPRVLPDHGRIFTPPFVEYIVRVLNRQALATATSR